LQDIRLKKNIFDQTQVSFKDWQNTQQVLLNQLEELGYPFASVFLDSIGINGSGVEALLAIDRGPLYKIDSIRVFGGVNVSPVFLQRYLNIYNGSIYNRKRLAEVGRKLGELPYVQEERPADVSYLSTGSVLNLYLKPKKNSQVNLLAGLLPNSDLASGRKFQFTVDANILLRNTLSFGETIGLTWQKLQPQSQRLNLIYEHPYVFKSPFGLGFNFAMFRKDSTFLNIDMKMEARYGAGEVQSASLFLLRRQSIVNGVNTAQVLFTRQLPAEVDVSSNNVGITYGFNNTNYRLNPQRGNEVFVTASAGSRQIRKNNQVVELKDPNDPGFAFESLYDTLKLNAYQFRIIASAARYFQLGRQGVFKLGLNGGVFGSERIFRNELFQIGGYRLLRGFDEESQYVSQYAVSTLEYRYLIGQNSFFFTFLDGGWAKHLVEGDNRFLYLGTGIGLSFETKAGLINLAWALGRRDDTEFNLRQSKVHLGFINYF
jgi:outer membrane protein assembly factor BamA